MYLFTCPATLTSVCPQYIVMAGVFHAAHGNWISGILQLKQIVHTTNVTFVSSKQVLDLKKKTVFICKWICEYSLRISLSYLYLTVFLYCFVFNFYKNIGYNEISVIIKTLKIQNDSCEHVKKNKN